MTPATSGDQLHQLVQRRHFTAGEDVGAIGGRGVLAAEPKPFDEIVNVGEMVVDFAASQHRKPAARDAAKQLQQPAIAGSVDAARPDDRHFDAEALAGLSREPLAFELRLLVDVAGVERRVLVGRRMLDVAVDADRAAVHDAVDARPRRGLDQLADRGRVHRAIGRRRDAGLPIDRGDVVDDVDALERRLDGATDRGDRRRASSTPAASRSRAAARVTHQHANRVAAGQRARAPDVRP